ncbi:hypothetical protein D3C77_655420 [compost metagenome]
MPLAQADEAVVRLDLHHIDAVVELHRHPVQRGIQHGAGRDDKSRSASRPGRHLQSAFDAPLQAGRLGAHPLQGIVPARPPFDRLEYVGRPQPAHQGIDGGHIHGLDFLLQAVAALAGEYPGLQAELRTDHLALEA